MRTKFRGILTLLLAFLVQLTFAQEKTISGTVVDENNLPLPGASVIIQGTSTGSATDFDGNYTIKANTGDVLVFSFVGYSDKTATVGATATINITMSPDTTLEEVVVIGYGQRTKRELTTNVAHVDGEAVQNVSVANVSAALQGNVSGVQIQQSSGAPGAGVRVRVRGASSVSGSNEPLYVIDGIPLIAGATLSDNFGGQQNNALSNLNPDDIESIDVLKDAAAASIYGSAGSNGVIIITTKRGKKGDAKISFNSYIGVQNPIKKYETMYYGDWLKFGDAYYFNSGNFPQGFWSSIWEGDPSLQNNTAALNTLYQSKRGGRYLDEVYVKDAAVRSLNASVSGGNDKTTYFIGASSFNQDGVLLNQNFKRESIRMNLDQKVSDKISITAGLSLSDETQNVISGDNNIFGSLSTAILEAPGNNIYNPDGSFDSTSYVFSNPVQNAVEDKGIGKSFRVLANTTITYNFTDNLFFTSRFGLDQLEFKERRYHPSTSAQGAGTNGFAAAVHNTFRRFNTTQGLNFNKTYDKVEIRAFAGAEYDGIKREFLSASKTNFPSTDLEYVSQGAELNGATASLTEDKGYSFIGRLGATFLDKYIVETSIRADSYSRFGANNKWGYFPSVSAGYIVSKEDWFNIDAISFFKLRGSWGQTGNKNANRIYTNLGTVQTANYAGSPGLVIVTGNANAKWETQTAFDVGFNLGLFSNRVNLEYNYYKQENKDLFLPVPNDESQGGGSIDRNTGVLENSGHEIGIAADIFTADNRDQFSWNTSINFSTLKNEITSMGASGPIDTGFVSRVQEGSAIGSFYVLQSDGLYQNLSEVPANLQAQGVGPGDVRYIDQNGDGIINDADKIIAGDPFADWTASWKNTIGYKGFDLDFLWAISQGNDVFNNNLQFAGASGNRIFNKFTSELNYWTPTNTNTNIPRPNITTQSYNNQESTRMVEDGSFIKLRNVTLGYTLPKTFKGIDKVRLYLSADNLIMKTDYSGVDPEVNFSGTQAVTAGTDFLTQGANRVYKFGVNINF